MSFVETEKGKLSIDLDREIRITSDMGNTTTICKLFDSNKYFQLKMSYEETIRLLSGDRVVDTTKMINWSELEKSYNESKYCSNHVAANSILMHAVELILQQAGRIS